MKFRQNGDEYNNEYNYAEWFPESEILNSLYGTNVIQDAENGVFFEELFNFITEISMNFF